MSPPIEINSSLSLYLINTSTTTTFLSTNLLVLISIESEIKLFDLGDRKREREEEWPLFTEKFLSAFLQVPLNPCSNPIRQEETDAQFNIFLIALRTLFIILISMSTGP